MHCLILDAHPVTQLGLSLIIEVNFPDWKITTATTVQKAIQTINEKESRKENQAVDLFILDVALGEQDGIAFLAYLRAHASAQPISSLVISSFRDQKTISLCRGHGARGYVSKDEGPALIIQAIRTVASGEEYFPNCGVIPAHNCPADPASSLKLTTRQRDIVDLVLAGYSNKKIAQALNLSYGTVKNYMFDLMRLLAVNSRLEMATKIRESRYRSIVSS